jgi:hypothetical protein
MYTANYIASQGLLTYSDKRIKTNIQDINDGEALSKLRLLQPKTFQYIDKTHYGSKPVYGFIAQEVGEIIDYSVTTVPDYIPNIFDKASVTYGNVIQLQNTSTSLFVQDVSNNPIKIKAYDISNNEILTTIVSIIDEKTFEIADTIKVKDLFVFGQEVSDFNSLEKESIFTITTAAVQQIDREFQEAKQTIQELQSQLATVLARLSAAGIA